MSTRIRNRIIKQIMKFSNLVEVASTGNTFQVSTSTSKQSSKRERLFVLNMEELTHHHRKQDENI